MKYIELRHFYYMNSDLLYLIYLHRFSGARLAFGDQGTAFLYKITMEINGTGKDVILFLRIAAIIGFFIQLFARHLYFQ